MNNLKNLKVSCLPVNNITGKIVHISVGNEKKRKEIYYLRNGNLNYVDLDKAEELNICTEVNDVIRTEYMSSHNKISISTKKNIFIIDCETKEFYKRDFDDIKEARWNSGFDCWAVLFESGQISTFTYDSRCELIDHATNNIDASVLQQASVGWGSQNTQFQGPNAPTEENINESSHITPIDNKTPIISWRGNGEEFLVSYIEKDVRVFKVFDHSCLPKSHSEVTKGQLYGPIAWKPQGSIIAAAMFNDGKNYIGLFETNGLFRMDLNLVDIFYPITSLSWSFCGKVLAICQEDDKKNSHLCLYTSCNMKWFLKQHLVFNDNNPLLTYAWMPTDPQCLELAVITKNEALQYKYKFQFDYDRNNNMIVAVNGRSLRIHVFSRSIDPSPSCTSVITCNDPINMAAFHPDKDLFAAIDSNNSIYCFNVNDDLSLISQSQLEPLTFPLMLNHLFWRAENPYFLLENPNERCSTLYEFNAESKEQIKIQQFNVGQYPIEQIYAVDNIVVKHDAKFRTIHRVQETPVSSLNVSYPYEVISLKYDTEIFSLVLNPNQDLYIEDEFVCRGITSMLVYKDYLLLTDISTLYTLKLTRESLDTLAVDGLSEFHTRPLNELAYLVCMIGDSSKIILHTPRGNLEIISCRTMQIRYIEELLVNNEWAEAIRIMRLERLDWNLLIDLDSERFYENISKVVAESDSQHILNAMVAEINDENCLTLVYKNTIDKIPYASLNKKTNFLEKLGEYLDQSGSFINYLPTVVKIALDQNNVLKALQYLSVLMRSIDKQQQKLDQAIAQIRTQVEAADMFKAALYTFNIELAEYVAQKCQMNPQEVGPLLEDLKNLNEFERRIHIHTKYQDWNVVVAYMLNRDQIDKDAILELIKERDVAKAAYMEAIKLKQLDFLEDIARLFAEKLVQKRKHGEAGVILVKYLMFDQAIEQFKMALDYKKCITYIPHSTYSDNGKIQLFIDLAGKLIAAQRIRDAAIIYETQLRDYSKAVETLTEGGMFTDALRIAKERSLSDMIDVLIIPKMFMMVEKIKGVIEDSSVKFKKSLERLNRLRNDKKYHLEKSMKRTGLGNALLTESLDFRRRRTDGLEGFAGQEFDLHSVVSNDGDPFFDGSDTDTIVTVRSHRSSRSNSSSSTTVTQKQVRKMEKQKQDTTEGSRFEDIALMRELHIMISLIFKYGPEARELFSNLFEYSIMDIPTLHQHHKNLYNLQVLMKDEVHNIWDEEFRSGSSVNHINENYFYMDEQYRVIPPEVENPGLSWTLDIFSE